ncbi:unnamed protein product, partial [Prorocentrum cordatum]
MLFFAVVCSSVVGSGSYGSVCEAKDKRNNRQVAIKRIGHLFDDLIDCKRILREIAIMRQLCHENVVQIYDIVEPRNMKTFDELYMVMEICDSDLKKLCRTDVQLEPSHVHTLLYNLLVGIKYLHSAGIYHRDLKPANCLVNQDCSVKICDFGLSRAIGEAARGTEELPNTPRGDNQDEAQKRPAVPHTQRLKRNLTGHVVSRWYRAPELILLQENYTEAIDVWSVGCIYAELLGMLEGTAPQERGPLFPGTSCFPLSPSRRHETDYKYHTRGKHDQLNMIFNLLGTPSDEEMDLLGHGREDAKRYLKCFAKRAGAGLQSKFPHIHPDAIALLGGLLKFNPQDRINVDKALDDPVFAEMRDPVRETPSAHFISLDFDREPDLDESKLRQYFKLEIRKYHPELQEEDKMKAEATPPAVAANAAVDTAPEKIRGALAAASDGADPGEDSGASRWRAKYGFYLHCFDGLPPILYQVRQIKQFFPGSPIYIMSDGGEDYSELCRQYGCQFELCPPANDRWNPWPFIRRFYDATVALNSEYVIMLEPDNTIHGGGYVTCVERLRSLCEPYTTPLLIVYDVCVNRIRGLVLI